MSLLVDVPATRPAERAYVLGVLLGDVLGLEHTTRVTAGELTRIRPAESPDGPAVVLRDGLLATPDERWLTPESLPRELEPPPLPDADVAIDFDLLGSAFFLLSRYEEVVAARADAAALDEHGRFPAGASLAGRAGLLHRALVDEYAELLWSALERCAPRLRRAPRAYRVLVSHDVDHPFATLGAPLKDVLRRAAGDVARRHEPALAARRLAARLARKGRASALDPFNTYHWLMDQSDRHGLRSAFYFLAAPDGTAYTSLYRLDDPPILTTVATIAARGHEIGLHGSYAAMRDPARLAGELSGLRALCDRLRIRQDRWGGRQHYLRWAPDATWAAWAQAGLDYDASAGFAEQPGFRTGTCREHAVFDVAAGRPLALRERPLTVMLDATLFRYMELDPDAAAAVVLELAATCRRHGGDCSLLVHNDFLAESWTRRWYADVLAAVT